MPLLLRKFRIKIKKCLIMGTEFSPKAKILTFAKKQKEDD